MFNKGLLLAIACLAIAGAALTGCGDKAKTQAAAPAQVSKDELVKYLDEMEQMPKQQRQQRIMQNREMMAQIAQDEELKERLKQILQAP